MDCGEGKVMYSFPELRDVILIPDVGYHLRQLSVGPPFLQVVVEGAWDRSDLEGQIAWLLSAGVISLGQNEFRPVAAG